MISSWQTKINKGWKRWGWGFYPVNLGQEGIIEPHRGDIFHQEQRTAVTNPHHSQNQPLTTKEGSGEAVSEERMDKRSSINNNQDEQTITNSIRCEKGERHARLEWRSREVTMWCRSSRPTPPQPNSKTGMVTVVMPSVISLATASRPPSGLP